MAINEEWLVSVNKKIAVLTKEVFRLHAESIDRKDDVKRLHAQLEDELLASTTKTSQSLNAAQNAMQTWSSDLETSVRDAHESAFRTAQKAYDERRGELEERSRRLVDFASSSLIQLRQSLADLKRKHEAQLAALSNAQQEIDKASEAALAAAGERHKRKLAARVTEANKEFNKLVMETAKEEEALKAKFDEEIAKLSHVDETEHFLHVRSDDELVIKASGLESRAVIRLKEQK